MKKYLLLAFFLLAPHAHAAQVILSANPGTGNQTWTVPADYDASTAKIECIGSGATGDGSTISTHAGASGGGGAYAAIFNPVLTPGASITYAIGSTATSTTRNVAAETYFNSTASTTASLYCDYGTFFTGNGGSAGQSGIANNGGTVARSRGTIKYAGGGGGSGSTSAQPSGAGGGGSAGPKGAGRGGGSGTSTRSGSGGGGGNGNLTTKTFSNTLTTQGGDGGFNWLGYGAGAGGTSGVPPTAGIDGGGGGGEFNTGGGAAGGCDTTIAPTVGACGGGGGGARTGGDGSGGNGGQWGGGGGGAGSAATHTFGGAGGQGVIVITYGVPHAKVSVIQSVFSLLKALFSIL